MRHKLEITTFFTSTGMQIHSFCENSSTFSTISRTGLTIIRSHLVHRLEARLCRQTSEFIGSRTKVDSVSFLSFKVIQMSV